MIKESAVWSLVLMVALIVGIDTLVVRACMVQFTSSLAGALR